MTGRELFDLYQQHAVYWRGTEAAQSWHELTAAQQGAWNMTASGFEKQVRESIMQKIEARFGKPA